jgi:hypothetical protein
MSYDLRLEDGSVLNSSQLFDESITTFSKVVAGASAPAATLNFASAAVEVGPSGTVVFQVGVDVGAGGGTAVAGDLIEAIATVDGATQAGQDTQPELSATHAVVRCTIFATVTGLVPGSSHTFGVQITNATNGAHTQILTGRGQITGWTY